MTKFAAEPKPDICQAESQGSNSTDVLLGAVESNSWNDWSKRAGESLALGLVGILIGGALPPDEATAAGTVSSAPFDPPEDGNSQDRPSVGPGDSAQEQAAGTAS